MNEEIPVLKDSNLGSAFFKKIETEADIVVRKKVIGHKNKEFFLKLTIFPKNVYEHSKNISFRFSENEG